MLLILGIVSLAYYGVLCVTLRKWNSTFSRFWLMLGILCVAGYVAADEAMLRTAGKIFILPAVIFAATECRIILGMAGTVQEEYSYIIILGAQVRGTRITDSLYRRLDKGLSYLSIHPRTNVIVSGGMGKGELVTEADAMAEYLLEKGIESERIIREDQSRTTEENLKFSAEYIEDIGVPVGIISNNFHLYRACCYARRMGYQNPRPIASGCRPVLLVNYMVREAFAVWKMWLSR